MKTFTILILLSLTTISYSFAQSAVQEQYVRDKLMDKFLASGENSTIQSSKLENKTVFICTKYCGNNDCPTLFTNHQNKVGFMKSDEIAQLGIPRNKYAEIISIDYEKETMSIGVKLEDNYKVLVYEL